MPAIPPPAPVTLIEKQSSLTTWNTLNISKLRQSLSKVMTGLGSFKFCAFGDSTTAGTVGGGGPSGGLSSWPYFFYKELKRRGIPARYDFYCAGTTVVGDPRITVGSGWSLNGGFFLYNPGNLTSAITIVPTDTCDRADIYIYDGISSGTLRTQFNSETAVDTALTNSNTIKKITVSAAALAQNTFKIFMSSGFFVGVDFYSSTTNEVRVLNFGTPGAITPSDGTSIYSLDKLAALFACDAYDFNFGINDWGSPDAATYGTKVTNSVTTLQAIGATVVLNYPTPSTAPDANQEAYFAQLKTIAAAKSCNLINLHARYGLTKTQAAANGWITDALHPTVYAYEDQGRYKAGLYLGHD